jgi:hypothetical protein
MRLPSTIAGESAKAPIRAHESRADIKRYEKGSQPTYLYTYTHTHTHILGACVHCGGDSMHGSGKFTHEKYRQPPRMI